MIKMKRNEQKDKKEKNDLAEKKALLCLPEMYYSTRYCRIS